MSPSTPSIRISGVVLLLMDPRPRMLNWMSCSPGWELRWITVRPGVVPASASVTRAIGRASSCSASTLATAPVRFTFRWVPYPTATIPSSSTASEVSWKFCEATCPAVTVTAAVCSA